MSGEVTGAFGILQRDGRYLLVANWRTFDGRRVLCWDLPGGGVRAHESLEEGCRREVLEETGFEIEVVDLAFMIERFGFRCDDPDRRSRYFFFHARAVADHGGPTDEKIVDWGFKTREELAALCTEPYHRELHAWLASGGGRRYFVDVRHPGRRRRG